MPDDLLALNGVVHLVHMDFKHEVGFILVDLGEIPSRHVDNSDCPARSHQVAPSISPLCPSLGEAVGRTPDSILNLIILLGASENVPHLDHLVFHQMLVEGVSDLHLTDECGGSHVIIAIICQSHLALETTDILFEALPRLHLDGEEVVDVLL